MASYSKKTRKTDPSYKRNKSAAPDTQLTLPLARAGSGNINVLAIDAPRLASGYGHRLYRQCGNYTLKVDLHQSGADVAGFQVVTLANNWYVKRAIQTARDMHDRAIADEAGHVKMARWYDFRISQGSIITGVSDDMLVQAGASPTAIGGLPFAGEWVESSIVDAAGNSRSFRLTGATSLTQYNIFQEYDIMGNASVEPGVANAGGYDDIDGSIDATNAYRIQEYGNNPPYHASDLPDQVFISQGHLYRSGGLGRESTGFFEAPLGLVWLVPDTPTNPNPQVMLEFKRGKYKGVSMTPY